MTHRFLPLLLIALAMALLLSQPLLAEDKPHEGKVVKAGNGKLTMTLKGDQKQHTHDVAKDAKVTLDAKTAKLEDLKEGHQIKVWMDDKHVVTKIEASTKAG